MMFRPSGPRPRAVAEPLRLDGPIELMISRALEHHAEDAARRERLAIVASRPDAPVIRAALARVDALSDVGVDLRVVLGRSWPRADLFDALVDRVGPDHVRLARFRGSAALRETGVFGALAEWTGARLPDARSDADHDPGRLSFFGVTRTGRRRMAQAHARFEAVWAAARTL